MRYIDADALKSRMFNYYECVNENTSKSGYKGETLMNYEVADMIDDCIDNAPTADVVEVKHGEWVPNELCGYKYAFYCSECGWVDGYPFNDRHKYCPNCGAKMDGERREE